jgi:hypothetical protein
MAAAKRERAVALPVGRIPRTASLQQVGTGSEQTSLDRGFFLDIGILHFLKKGLWSPTKPRHGQRAGPAAPCADSALPRANAARATGRILNRLLAYLLFIEFSCRSRTTPL